MGGLLGWLALIGIILFIAALGAMVIVAALQIFKAAFVQGIALFKAAPVRGKHDSKHGRHSARVPVESDAVKDIEGWEADEVDATTGEIKSFVWRGGK